MRYKRSDFNSAARAAQRASEGDGRLRYVMATGLGFHVTTMRIKWQDVWWTNGSDCGIWKAGAESGITQNAIARKEADRLVAD